MDNRDKRNVTMIYISVGVCLLLYLSTYLMKGDGEEVVVEDAGENATVDSEEVVVRKVRAVVVQPTCHLSYMYLEVLPEIIDGILLSKRFCTPEDFHNEEKHRIPKSASKTPKVNEPPDVVIFIAVALLLTSLGAAFLDFYRAKADLLSPDGNKKKPSLTRRCSLADLTVLRHSRKESMRKDAGYDAAAKAKDIGNKRILHRQCTLPGTSIDFQNIQLLTNGSRRGSLACMKEEDPSEHKHTHYRLFLRRH